MDDAKPDNDNDEITRAVRYRRIDDDVDTEVDEAPTPAAPAAPDDAQRAMPSERAQGRVAELEQRLAEQSAELSWVNERLVSEIYDRDEAESTIERLERYDTATGLPNRRLFEERIGRVITQHLQVGEPGAVLCIAAHGVAEVRHAQGIGAADHVVRQLGDRLRLALRGTDIIARLADDLFGIWLGHLRTLDDALVVAGKLAEVVETPLRIDGGQTCLRVSIGIAGLPLRAEDADDLLTAAEAALQFVQTHGLRMNRSLHADHLGRRTQRLRLRAALLDACANRRIGWRYEPEVNLRGTRWSGVRAVAHWHDGERTAGERRGSDAPDGDELLDLIEQARLAVPLGEALLAQACTDAAAWPEAIGVTVGLTPSQLRCESLLDWVERALAVSGLGAGRLELEITEEALGPGEAQVDAAAATIAQLRSRGVRVALREVGRGACSLRVWRACPVDRMVIDAGLIGNLSDDAGASAVVRMLANVARELDAVAVAAGVSTAVQRDAARAAGCRIGRGAFFGPTVDASDVLHHLGRARQKPADGRSSID